VTSIFVSSHPYHLHCSSLACKQKFSACFQGRLLPSFCFAPDTSGDLCLLPAGIVAAAGQLCGIGPTGTHRLCAVTSAAIESGSALVEHFRRHTPGSEVLVVGKRGEGAANTEVVGSAGAGIGIDAACSPENLEHWFLIRGLSCHISHDRKECHRNDEAARFSGHVWNFTGNAGVEFALKGERGDAWWSELGVSHLIVIRAVSVSE